MAKKLQQECLTLYPETELIIRRLNDQQVGRLIRALVQYRYHGTETEITDDISVAIAYDFMVGQVDRMEQVKERNTAAAKARWDKKTPPTPGPGIRISGEETDSDFPY